LPAFSPLLPVPKNWSVLLPVVMETCLISFLAGFLLTCFCS
jgi:hypothetical protein